MLRMANPSTLVRKYIDRFLLGRFLASLAREGVCLEIKELDGTIRSYGRKHASHRLTIRHPRFFNALIAPDAFTLGDAYVRGYYDISGDLRELYEKMASRFLSRDRRISVPGRIAARMTAVREKEKKNIHYHYDVPAEFYQGFLGKTMGYTCGYYDSESASMDDAQYEKMDLICRKLRLKSGERLLDVGCGWGSFILYAAKQYGVEATGITLSRAQADYARAWIEREGLSDRVRVQMINYRDISGEPYDKISCIGMSEHVGGKFMSLFFSIVHRNLADHGLFLQHTITTNVARKQGYENRFLNALMFPGGELLPQHTLVETAGLAGFELLSAENFRTHYVTTLQDWILKMEENRRKLLAVVSGAVYRTYHVFFIGSLVCFNNQEISLFQNLFYKKVGDGNMTDYFLSPFSRGETRIA